jgi:hypothetical protein
MRKNGENNVNLAGKSAIPPDRNNDFTVDVESQTIIPPLPIAITRSRLRSVKRNLLDD